MDGKTLKERIQRIEPSMVKVARKIGVSPQSLAQTLQAADIKTGFVERLASAYGLPVNYFFGETTSAPSSRVRNQAVSSDAELIAIIRSQQETIRELMSHLPK